jgi:hypothetical protein
MAHIHGLLLAEFEAAAARAAAERPEVDAETARELMAEAAEMLHNSLALDALDESDAAVVIRDLAADLTSADPGAAVRARSAAVSQDPGGLAEPAVVAETYLVCAAVLGL